MNSLSDNGSKHILNASGGDLMALIIVPGEMERNASNHKSENKQARSPAAPTPRSSTPCKTRASKNKPKQRHGNSHPSLNAISEHVTRTQRQNVNTPVIDNVKRHQDTECENDNHLYTSDESRPPTKTANNNTCNKRHASKNEPKQCHGNAPLTGSPAELPKFTPHTPTPSTVIV